MERCNALMNYVCNCDYIYWPYNIVCSVYCEECVEYFEDDYDICEE